MIALPTQHAVIPAQPLTEVRFYAGVPWTNDYKDVLLCDSKDDFLSKLEQWRYNVPGEALNNLAPIRLNTFDVRLPADEMLPWGLNYCAFRNYPDSDFSNNEWTFCFITELEWLSRNSTRVHLEHDEFQNEFYDLAINDCMIERMHIPKVKDRVGYNLVPDNLETGEYIDADIQRYSLQPNYLCVYLSVDRYSFEPAEGSIKKKIYLPLNLYIFDTRNSSEIADCNAMIASLVDNDKKDAIIAMFQAPNICVNQIPVDTITCSYNDKFFEGYVPKNAKLYTYPYCYIYATNYEGTSAIYKYELENESETASHPHLSFEVYGANVSMPQVVTYPVNYKEQMNDYNDAIIMASFPQNAWTYDTYAAYCAQNESAIALNGMSIVGTGVMGVGAIMTGAAAPVGIGLLTSSFQQALNLWATQSDVHRKPPTMSGSTQTGYINTFTEHLEFAYITKTVKKEMAKVIDDFYTMYGYPIHQILSGDEIKQRMKCRPYWVYIKTINCSFTSNSKAKPLGMDHLKHLRQIFDTGVTLWQTKDIGHYTMDNNA